MKILLIDDQRLVTLPLQKRLTELGYDVKTLVSSVTAIEVYETYLPDLVIMDMNMPTINGLDIITYVRQQKGDRTPIIVLSGNTDDDLIMRAFKIGIQQYIKKPLSLTEVCNRVEELIGPAVKVPAASFSPFTHIPKKCTGIVIPCQNQEAFLKSNAFTKFLNSRSGYQFCFINNGSTDNTQAVLNELKTGKENYVTVYKFDERRSISQIIRFGMLSLSEQEDLDYVGFLDPNQLKDFSELEKLEQLINAPNPKMVNNIAVHSNYPKIVNGILNFATRKIFGINYAYGQHLVYIMKRDIVQYVFKENFRTDRLLSLEMRVRMKKIFGRYERLVISETTAKTVSSPVTDFPKTIKQIFQIVNYYKNYKTDNKFIFKPQHS